MLHQTATFGETTGRRSATKRHKIHKRICIFCAFLWLISLPDGDDRVRTDGLRSASAALSQLSYIPSTKPITIRSMWAWVELNYRPHAYQACALTT